MRGGIGEIRNDMNYDEDYPQDGECGKDKYDESAHLIGEEVFIKGLGYIVWDEANEQAARGLAEEIERISPERRVEARGGAGRIASLGEPLHQAGDDPTKCKWCGTALS